MAEQWSVLDGERLVSGDHAAGVVSANVDDGRTTTYLRSGSGRLLVVVSNGDRAMVVLMSGEGDAGEHAVSPGATGSSDGYVLENDQEDTYENADTVPLTDALDAVRSTRLGPASPGQRWSVDR